MYLVTCLLLIIINLSLQGRCGRGKCKYSLLYVTSPLNKSPLYYWHYQDFRVHGGGMLTHTDYALRGTDFRYSQVHRGQRRAQPTVPSTGLLHQPVPQWAWRVLSGHTTHRFHLPGYQSSGTGFSIAECFINYFMHIYFDSGPIAASGAAFLVALTWPGP